MANQKHHGESELGELAKLFRSKSGKTKEEAAHELGVARSSLQLAEGTPGESLTKLRIRIIEKYSSFKVVGPVYLLKRK
jgi:DNA-binding XRE family transcriptional regulator